MCYTYSYFIRMQSGTKRVTEPYIDSLQLVSDFYRLVHFPNPFYAFCSLFRLLASHRHVGKLTRWRGEPVGRCTITPFPILFSSFFCATCSCYPWNPQHKLMLSAPQTLVLRKTSHMQLPGLLRPPRDSYESRAQWKREDLQWALRS